MDYPLIPKIDIAILGSSRPRDGILPPELKTLLVPASKKSLHIVNYAKSGGRAFDFEVLAERLVENKQPPKLVVLPMNPRFTQSGAARNNLRFPYMKPRQLAHEITVHGLSAPLRITEVLISNVFPHLTGLRQAAREWVEGQLEPQFDPFTHNPIVGGHNKLQRRDINQLKKGKSITSIAIKRPKAERVQEYVKVEWPKGTTHSSPKAMAALKSGLRRLKDQGVTKMLMDLPMSPVLSDNYPPNRLPEYRAQLAQLAQEMGVTFVPASAFRPFMMRTSGTISP